MFKRAAFSTNLQKDRKTIKTKGSSIHLKTYIAFELLSVWIVILSMRLQMNFLSEQKSAVAGESFSFEVSLQKMPTN